MGGNVFKNIKTSFIPANQINNVFNKTENIITEIFNFKKQKFPKYSYIIEPFFSKCKNEIVGQKDKKYLGDLDLAVSEKDFIDRLNILGYSYNDKKISKSNLFEFLKIHFKDHFRSKSILYSFNKGLRQIHLAIPYKQIEKGINGKSNRGKRYRTPRYVQVDILLGNVSWMKKIHSGVQDSKYKALYRTNLLREFITSDLFSNKFIGVEEKEEIQKFVLNYKKGLMTKSLSNNKNKLFTSNINIMCSLIFGSDIQWKDIDNFEKLFKVLTKTTPDLLESYFSFNSRLSNLTPPLILPYWMNILWGNFSSVRNHALESDEEYLHIQNAYFKELKKIFIKFNKELTRKCFPIPKEIENYLQNTK